MTQPLTVLVTVSYLERIMRGLLFVGDEVAQYEFHKAGYLFRRGDGLELFDKHQIILRKCNTEIKMDADEYKEVLNILFIVMDSINEVDINLARWLISEEHFQIEVEELFPASLYEKFRLASQRDEMDERKREVIDV